MLTNRLLALLLAALLLSATGVAQTVLRYSDHEPLGGMRTRFLEDVLFAAIEKESNGRLKIEAHWDSTISTGYDALGKVGDGKEADMAIVVPEYSATQLPLHQIFKGFPTGPYGDKQVAFFRRAYAEVPAFRAELAKNNVVEMFLATGYPVAFFSNQPMHSLKDLRGHTWRSASFWHTDFLRNAGAIPVSMPWGEGVFKALRDQSLDGLMVNVDSGYMLKVHEVAPHVLLSRDLWLGHLYIVAVNRGVWENLSKEDKDAIHRATEAAYKALGPLMEQSFLRMVTNLRASGADMRLLDQAELDAWNATTKYQDIQAKWARDQESKGVKNAGVVLEKIVEMRSDTKP